MADAGGKDVLSPFSNLTMICMFSVPAESVDDEPVEASDAERERIVKVVVVNMGTMIDFSDVVTMRVDDKVGSRFIEAPKHPK